MNKDAGLSFAVAEIKAAILSTRYMAARLANGEMLKLYFGIGAYVSANSRKGKWGTGAIREISSRLQQELPGLKGFSESFKIGEQSLSIILFFMFEISSEI